MCILGGGVIPFQGLVKENFQPGQNLENQQESASTDFKMRATSTQWWYESWLSYGALVVRSQGRVCCRIDALGLADHRIRPGRSQAWCAWSRSGRGFTPPLLYLARTDLVAPSRRSAKFAPFFVRRRHSERWLSEYECLQGAD